MLFNKRDTVLIDKIEYICYREDDRISIMIQDFFPERIIGEIIDYIEDKGKITWNVYNSNNNNEYKKSMEINKDYFYGLFSTNYLTMSQIDDNLKNFNRYFKQFGKN